MPDEVPTAPEKPVPQSPAEQIAAAIAEIQEIERRYGVRLGAELVPCPHCIGIGKVPAPRVYPSGG